MATTAQDLSRMSSAFEAGTAAQLSQVHNNLNTILGVSSSNSAFNAEQARLNREWQAEQAELNRQFNAAEAATNRNWQEYMSNTAHQREVADLRAAGLNPVLSAMNGNGAAVTSGATASGSVGSGSSASADASANSAIVSLLGSSLSAMTQLASMSTTGLTNLAIADKNNAASQLVAQIAAEASMYGANRSYQSAKNVQSMKNTQEEFMAKNYPNNLYQSIAAVLNAGTGIIAGDNKKTFWQGLSDLAKIIRK